MLEKNINKQNEKYIYYMKYIFLIVLIMVFSLIIYYTSNIILIILLFIIVGIFCLSFVDFDLLHPYTWFLPFFILYSISFSILYVTNNLSNNVEEFFLIKSLQFSWIAFITFIIVISPKKYYIKFNKQGLLNSNFIVRLMMIFSIIGISLFCLFILSTGVSTKRDIAIIDSNYITLGAYSIEFFTFAYSIILINKLAIKARFNKWFIISVIIMTLLVIFIAGERDFLLKIVLITLLISNVFVRRISTGKLMILGFIGVLSLGVLQNLKNIFLHNQTKVFQEENNIFLSIFSGEFISAGRNLYVLNENMMEKIFQHDITLFSDIKFAFLNLPFLNANEVFRPTTWFNNTFYSGHVAQGGGMGFTMVGEGFINLGSIGVIIWFLIIGLIVKYIYINSNLNIFWFVIYILLIPISIYSLRADLGILFSYLLKYILIPLIFVKIYMLIMKNKRYELRSHNSM